MMTDANRAAFG